jgi:hypothetical protein
MQPLHFTLRSGRSIMVLPDAEVKHDGHPILSLHYNVFRSNVDINVPEPLNDLETEFPDKFNPDFLGYVSFEIPGMRYSYTSAGDWALNRDEVAEVIEQVNFLRDNPGLWKID